MLWKLVVLVRLAAFFVVFSRFRNKSQMALFIKMHEIMYQQKFKELISQPNTRDVKKERIQGLSKT